MKKITVMLIACMCAGVSAMAQVTCSRAQVGESKIIQSSTEYKLIQDSVQALAYELYLIGNQYPNYKFVHQSNDEGAIVAVSVVGISDSDLATRAARNLMILEVLGERVRSVDVVHLPKQIPFATDGMVSQTEAEAYQPAAPAKVKETKTVIASTGI